MNEDIRVLVKEVLQEIHKDKSPSGYSMVLLVLLSAGSTGLGVNYISKEESAIMSNISLVAEKEIREASDDAIQQQINRIRMEHRNLQGELDIFVNGTGVRIHSIEDSINKHSNEIDFLKRWRWSSSYGED